MPRSTTTVPSYVYVLLGGAGALVILAWVVIFLWRIV
jgi:hypothetical protein